MKENYLWDKTGNDPEIEKLENALQAFRYKETAPPALSVKVLPFRKETPRQVFSFALAFAACAALVIILVGAWFQISRNKIEVATDLAETITPQTTIEFPNDSIVKKVETSEQFAEHKIIKVRKVVPLIAHQHKTITKNLKVKEPHVRLTKEEKYAYDQLMLALSITSSKLKLVKDKIEGIEEQTAVLKDGR